MNITYKKNENENKNKKEQEGKATTVARICPISFWLLECQFFGFFKRKELELIFQDIGFVIHLSADFEKCEVETEMKGFLLLQGLPSQLMCVFLLYWVPKGGILSVYGLEPRRLKHFVQLKEDFFFFLTEILSDICCVEELVPCVT